MNNHKSSQLNSDIIEVTETTTLKYNRLPSFHPNMVLQEAVNLVTEGTYSNVGMDI